MADFYRHIQWTVIPADIIAMETMHGMSHRLNQDQVVSNDSRPADFLIACRNGIRPYVFSAQNNKGRAYSMDVNRMVANRR